MSNAERLRLGSVLSAFLLLTANLAAQTPINPERRSQEPNASVGVNQAGTLDFNSGSLGTINVVPSTFYFTPTGGTAPYAFSWTPSTTPIPGFRVITWPEMPCNPPTTASTGALVGVPAATGTQSGSVRLRDNTGNTVDKTVSVNVLPLDLIGGLPYYLGAGDSVSQHFLGVGGLPGYSYSIVGTPLPAGLALDPATGLLSGTVWNSGSLSFRVQVQDSGGHTFSRSYSYWISPLRFSSIPANRVLPNAVVGQFYSQLLQVSGGSPPYTYSVSNVYLPTGLVFADGIVSGTATSAYYNGYLYVTVRDTAGNANSAYLGLNAVPQSSPSPLSFFVSSTTQTSVGSSNAWTWSASGGLPPYSFDVAPGSTLPEGAAFGMETFGYGFSGNYGLLYLKIPVAGTYSTTLRVTDAAGNTATGSLTIQVSPLVLMQPYRPSCAPPLVLGQPYSQYVIPAGGTPPYSFAGSVLPAGLTVDDSGFVSGTPLESSAATATTYYCGSWTYNFADSAGNHDSYSPCNRIYGTGTNTGVSITNSIVNYSVREGVQFSYTLSCLGSTLDPPNYNVTLVSGSLPPGLTLLTPPNFNNSNNASYCAQIAGVATTLGNYSAILRITDASGSAGQRQVSFHVIGLNFATTYLPNGTVGVSYNVPVSVYGGTPPYSFTATLPPGLGIDPVTGVISGTPTAPFSGYAYVYVTDHAGDTYSYSYSVTIYSNQIQITSPNVLSAGIYRQAYTPYTFTATPAGSYTWTTSSTPSGMSLSPAGVLSGTPSFTGYTSMTVSASNGTVTVSKPFTLFSRNISDIPVMTSLPTTRLGDYLVNNYLTYTFSPYGGTPSFTVTLVPGSSLPPGLSLVPAETYGSTYGLYGLRGVPATPGYYTFHLRFADSSGITEDRTVSMNITSLALAATSLGPVTVNVPFSAQLVPLGGSGSYTFSLANIPYNVLPPGLTLSSTGLLSGTPNSTGSFSFTLVLASGSDSRRVSISLYILANSTGFIYNGIPISQSDLVIGRNFSYSMYPQPYTYSPSSYGTCVSCTWSVIGTLPPGVRFLYGGTLPPGYGQPYGVLAGAPTTPGAYTFGLRVDDTTGNFGVRYITLNVSPLRLGPANQPLTLNPVLPAGQAGTPYSFGFNVVNGHAPYTFALEENSMLPAGVTLSGAGQLSGTPSEAGNFTLNLLVTDNAGVTLRTSLPMTVYPAGQPIGITGLTNRYVPNVTLGTPYSFALNNLLNPGFGTPPFVWSLASGTLPPGLSLVPGSGSASALITGTATSAGFWSTDLMATDAAGRKFLATYIYFQVSALAISPAASNLPSAVSGAAYSQAIAASGGTPPYNYQLAYNSDLPPGLSLSAGGLLSGATTTLGAFQLTVQVVDNVGVIQTKQYTLDIVPPAAPSGALTVSPSSIGVNYVVGDPTPPPVQISVGSTTTAMAFGASASGVSWLSLTPGTGSTPGTVTVTFSMTGLAAGTYNGAITLSSGAASNSPVTVPVQLQVAAAPSCSFALSPNTGTVAADGGTGSFTVNTASGCSWSATSSDAWLTLSSAGSGTGTGTIGFSATANLNSTTRSATVTVQGLTYTVTQFGTVCSFSISPGSLTVTAAGGTALVTINAAAAGCPWTASAVDGWITLGSAGSTGSGTISVTISANTLPSSRSGTATIAGQPFSVGQNGLSCTYSLSNPGASVPAGGGTASVNLTTGSACAWTIDPGPSWITVTSALSGSGFTPVSLTVGPNSTVSARSATVLIGGQSYPITQAGVPCSFSLSSNNPVQPSGGGTGSVDIVANGSGCSWVASSNASWLTLSSASGSGNASPTFSVGSNGAPAARSGTITIAGQNIIVNQSGLTCSYSLRSTSATMPSGAGSSSVGVVTAAGCSSTASTGSPWIHVTGGASLSGPGDVTFSVDANPAAAERTDTITIAGQTFAVTQAAASCVVSLSSPTFSIDGFGGTGGFTYTTGVLGCPQTVRSYAGWITVTSSTYSGSGGSVSFTVAANTNAVARSGDIRVGDQAFTVTQAATTCAYTLSNFGMALGRLGGDGAVPMTFAPPACGPPPVSINAPTGMLTLGTMASGPGTYSQNFTVGIYLSVINYVRTGQLLVNGQIFAVKQSSW